MATSIAECDCAYSLSRIWAAAATPTQGNNVDTTGVCPAELQSISSGFFRISKRLRLGPRPFDGRAIASATGLATTELDRPDGSFTVVTDMRFTRRPGQFHMAQFPPGVTRC